MPLSLPLRKGRTTYVVCVAAAAGLLILGGAWSVAYGAEAPLKAVGVLPVGNAVEHYKAPLCEKSEGLATEVCHDIMPQEGSCEVLLSQTVLVLLSILGGLFGLDQLYARNMQLFLPKMFLSLVLIPWAWKRLLASVSKRPPPKRPTMSLRSLSVPTSAQDKQETIAALRKKLYESGPSEFACGEEEEEDEDKIDKVKAFDWNKLALFTLILVLSHVWWAVDVLLWCFDYYSTGVNGAWFGNPIQQCPLKSW